MESSHESRPIFGSMNLQLLSYSDVTVKQLGIGTKVRTCQLSCGTYDASGYADHIYAGELEPPLEGGTRQWAQDLLTRQQV